MSTLLSSHKTDALHSRDTTLWAVIGGQCNTVSGLTRAHIPCTSVAGGKCQCTPWSTRWTHRLTQRANVLGGKPLQGRSHHWCTVACCFTIARFIATYEMSGLHSCCRPCDQQPGGSWVRMHWSLSSCIEATMAGGVAALTYTGCIGGICMQCACQLGGDAWLAVILLQPGSCFVACSWYWSCCASVSACVLGVTTWFTRCQLSANETGLGGSCKACKSCSAEPDSCWHRVKSFGVLVLGCNVFTGCNARLTVSLLETQLGSEMAKDRAGSRLPRRRGSREVPLAPYSPFSDHDFIKYRLRGMLSCEMSQTCHEQTRTHQSKRRNKHRNDPVHSLENSQRSIEHADGEASAAVVTLSSINSFKTKIFFGIMLLVHERHGWPGSEGRALARHGHRRADGADSNAKHTRRHDRLQSEESTFCT